MCLLALTHMDVGELTFFLFSLSLSISLTVTAMTMGLSVHGIINMSPAVLVGHIIKDKIILI